MDRIVKLKFELKESANPLSELREEKSELYRYFSNLNALTPIKNMKKEYSEYRGYRYAD